MCDAWDYFWEPMMMMMMLMSQRQETICSCWGSRFLFINLHRFLYDIYMKLKPRKQRIMFHFMFNWTNSEKSEVINSSVFFKYSSYYSKFRDRAWNTSDHGKYTNCKSLNHRLLICYSTTLFLLLLRLVPFENCISEAVTCPNDTRLANLQLSKL